MIIYWTLAYFVLWIIICMNVPISLYYISCRSIIPGAKDTFFLLFLPDHNNDYEKSSFYITHLFVVRDS